MTVSVELRGRVVENLDHAKVIEDLQSGLSYDEVGELHNCSKGSIWKIVRHYNAMRHPRKDALAGMRGSWACGRPMAKYKGAYPNGFLKRVDKIIDSLGRTLECFICFLGVFRAEKARTRWTFRNRTIHLL